MEKQIRQIIHETMEPIFEMANIEQELTGLEVLVFASPKMGSHGPRIKFQNGYETRVTSKSNLIPMSISSRPEVLVDVKLKISKKDLNKIKQWIILNKEVLLKYWNQEVNTREFINSIKEI
jgi:hypothetical protein